MGHSSSSAGTVTVIFDEGQAWPTLNGDVSFFVAVTCLQKISNSIEVTGPGAGQGGSTDGFEMQLDMSLAMDLGRLRFFF
jgi:hypothetical protein